MSATLPARAPLVGTRSLSFRSIDRCVDSVVIGALLVELTLVVANVFARIFVHHSFLWADEVARMALSILTFIGGAAAYRRRDHAFGLRRCGT